MTPRRRHPRRLQPGEAGADDRHALGTRRRRRVPAGLVRMREHGILEAADGFAGVNLAPAIVAEGAGADIAGPAGPCLARPVGVRYQQPAEADHVAGAVGKGRLRGLRRFDPAEADHREPAGNSAQPRVQRQEGPGRVVHVRQMGIEIGTERPLAEGEIVERLPADLRGRDGAGDALRLVGVDAARHALVGRQLDADDEVGAAGGADRRQHLAQEAQAAREAAAVAVPAVVAGGREELRDQVAVGAVQLDAAEAGALEPLRALRIARDDAGNLVPGERPCAVPVERVRLRRRAARHRIETPELLAADMAELADEPAAGAFHRLRPARQPCEVALVMDAHQDRRAAAGRVHVHQLAHDHRGAALGARRVIGDQAVGHGTVTAEAGHGRGVDDAVAQFASAHRDRAEERVEGHGAVGPEGCGRRSLGHTVRQCRGKDGPKT